MNIISLAFGLLIALGINSTLMAASAGSKPDIQIEVQEAIDAAAKAEAEKKMQEQARRMKEDVEESNRMYADFMKAAQQEQNAADYAAKKAAQKAQEAALKAWQAKQDREKRK